MTTTQGSSGARLSLGTTTHRRPVAVRLARLALAWAALGWVIPSHLEAQTCLGFSGQGFLGASGAVRSEWSYNMTGVGAVGGVSWGRLAATGHYLKFSGTDEFDQDSDFESARATLGYEFSKRSLSLCPVLTSGREGVSSREFSSIPYKSGAFFGGGLAVGHRFGAADSGVTIIPSLSIGIENHVVTRIIEGDILIDERGTSARLHGGVTVEFGRLFVRPYAALIAVENGWLTGGARFGLAF